MIAVDTIGGAIASMIAIGAVAVIATFAAAVVANAVILFAIVVAAIDSRQLCVQYRRRNRNSPPPHFGWGLLQAAE
jgi:hypothetical protein